MTAALMVTYPASEGATFDRAYYTATHLPLVSEKFAPHGMVDSRAYFPDAPDAPFLAIGILTFADAAARDAALSSPDAAPVFGDIPNFTNVQPIPAPLSVG